MLKRDKNRKLSIDFMSCSQMSVISAMNKFVESVDEMNDIVLVPSKLMDIESNLTEEIGDLHTIHGLLNQLKDELTQGRLEEDFMPLRGKKLSSSCPSPSRSMSQCNNSSNNNRRIRRSGKERTPESDDGFSSLNSFSQCCTDDESSDKESEFSKCETKELCERDGFSSPQCLINLFRLHIQGMKTTLNRFAEYANQVSESYRKNNKLDS